MEDARRHVPLLDGPATLVQRGVCTEEAVGGIRLRGEVRSGVVCLRGDDEGFEQIGRAVEEAADSAVTSDGGSDFGQRAAIDKAHDRALSPPIFFVVLDDAKGVYPNI